MNSLGCKLLQHWIEIPYIDNFFIALMMNHRNKQLICLIFDVEYVEIQFSNPFYLPRYWNFMKGKENYLKMFSWIINQTETDIPKIQQSLWLQVTSNKALSTLHYLHSADLKLQVNRQKSCSTLIPNITYVITV